MIAYDTPISTKETFLDFLAVLQQKAVQQPQDWNMTLPDYLAAMQSWVEDMEQYYVNTGQPIPENINWRAMADILAAAAIYE